MLRFHFVTWIPGKYSVHFEPSRLEDAVPEISNDLAPARSQIISKELNLDARAVSELPLS